MHRISVLVPFLASLLATLAFAPMAQGDECVTIAFQGNVGGKIEDCGCPKRPLGGLPHRAHLLEQMGEQCENLLVVDAGNLLGAPNVEGGLSQNRFLAAQSAAMGYAVLGVGKKDLAFGLDFARALQDEHGIALVSTNLTQDGEPVFAPYHIEKIAGIRIGFLSVSAGDRVFTELGLSTEPELAAVQRGLAQLEGKVDLTILLSNLDRGRTQKLLRDLPAGHGLDFAIEGATGSHFKTAKAINGGQLLAANSQGKYMGELKLTVADGQYLDDFAFELHAVDIKGPQNADMAKRLARYLSERAASTGSR